ncbi:hypothetical protein [Saccharothrix violaceirubra]|uniref:Uncharacterized protein n=1 Tax=Saccharothrix violaceirubra TaxID=413306 RepID=A0A7W7SYB2_9PSEU|nr:hypothetical protein [Saccharothrix violaceirubra]MBB4963143.1 hypothetical protein [Saccharothrix violaceirubra]
MDLDGQAENVKHLEFIQGVITRVANSSFLIKGWTLTVTAALLGFAAQGSSRRLTLIGLVAVVGFWVLDAFYLRQERLYRKLYDDVRRDLDFERFSMDVRPYRKAVPLWRVLFSRTLLVFYGALVLVTLAILIFAPIVQKIR